MCKLGRVHTQATTIFLTHAHQWHVGWDYGKMNETRSGTLLKTKAWTSQFPLESVNSWQDRSRWKDRAIFKLFANFCHRAGDTRSPSWGPWMKTWIPLPALLQQRPMPWMTRWQQVPTMPEGMVSPRRLQRHLKGKRWKATSGPARFHMISWVQRIKMPKLSKAEDVYQAKQV